MSDKKTVIWVSERVWKNLQSRKEIGESFDLLLVRLLELEKIEGTENAKASGMSSMGGDMFNGG
jgi:hypothetical protein